jgi:hypothetical protein
MKVLGPACAGLTSLTIAAIGIAVTIEIPNSQECSDNLTDRAINGDNKERFCFLEFDRSSLAKSDSKDFIVVGVRA